MKKLLPQDYPLAHLTEAEVSSEVDFVKVATIKSLGQIHYEIVFCPMSHVFFFVVWQAKHPKKYSSAKSLDEIRKLVKRLGDQVVWIDTDFNARFELIPVRKDDSFTLLDVIGITVITIFLLAIFIVIPTIIAVSFGLLPVILYYVVAVPIILGIILCS